MSEQQAVVPADASGAADLEHALRALGSAERAVGARAYLKSDLEFTGTPVPVIRSSVASWYRRTRPCSGPPGRTRP